MNAEKTIQNLINQCAMIESDGAIFGGGCFADPSVKESQEALDDLKRETADLQSQLDAKTKEVEELREGIKKSIQGLENGYKHQVLSNLKSLS